MDIYIDLLISNVVQTTTNQRVELKFFESRSQPIIKDTTGYRLSIVRFSINTETLPIFIPTMLNNDNQTTIYSITMEYNGQYYQKYMLFSPQNLNPIDIDEYFYVYSYQYLMYLVNNCFNDCLTGLSNLINLATDTPPSISFDNSSQLCSVQWDSNYYGYNQTNKINVYFNLAMYNLFCSLPAYKTNINQYGKDYQLSNLWGTNQNIMTQDNSSTALWNPVSSIVFTTNLMPIVPSQTPPIQIYKNGQSSNISSSQNFLNIITDFIGSDLLFTPYIQYTPYSYRYINLAPNLSINSIDLQVYWINKTTGLLKPLYLGINGSCSVKILLTSEN
jgi:hypothetical protein